ncbi:MAG: transcriptional regulator [Collinsella sp.]
MEFYKRLAHGLALQFGPNCEVVVHDLETEDVDHSIVVIENGHVSGRKLGDGPSHIVFESMHEGSTDVHDREPYLTKTTDGKLLKSSTIFIRNDEGKPVGILGINFDITLMKAFERSLDAFTGTGGTGYTEPEPITKNIGDLLEDLLHECEQFVGKPAALMTSKRIRAMATSTVAGLPHFQIKRTYCEFFGISKYSFAATSTSQRLPWRQVTTRPGRPSPLGEFRNANQDSAARQVPYNR